MKKKLLTESQMRRMAAIAGIPALGGIVGRLSEKLDIQAEQEEVVVKEEEEEEVSEGYNHMMDVAFEIETLTDEDPSIQQDNLAALIAQARARLDTIEREGNLEAFGLSDSYKVEEGGDHYNEEEMEMDAEAEVEMEEPAGEEVSQDKIESLVDAVLAAIETETGVPAERVDSEEEAPAEEPEMEMDAEAEMDMEPEMDAEEEMMETVEPTLAERLAQAVQAVIDEDAAVAEGYDMDEKEEQIEESAEEDAEEEVDAAEEQLDEITKAVVARLRSLK